MVETQATGDKPRLLKLKEMEEAIRVRTAELKITEVEALQGYETMTFEEKNQGKFMSTFPYPYMNGYLHLGKLRTNDLCFSTATNFVFFRSRLLNVQVRVRFSLPTPAGKESSLPPRLPLHRHAHFSFRKQTQARNRSRQN